MNHRPWGITLLAWLALLFAAVHLARCLQAIQSWDLLDQLLPYSPGYLVFTGLIWAPIGFVFSWGIFKGRSWVLRNLPAAFLAYSVYYWLEYFFIPSSGGGRQNGPFLLGINILIFFMGAWLLTRAGTKLYFGEHTHGRSSEDQQAA